jgi:catechol 2,3-dioxygenase-like lactoylglutathione lyase family enzyme
MSQTDASISQQKLDAGVGTVDMKLEVIVVPVSDVDRAKGFYQKLGWRLDADYDSGKDFRVLQFTPPGSGCSIIFGKNVTAAAPGSAQGLYLIVSDIEASRAALLGRGVEISEVFHDANGVYAGPDAPYLFGRQRVSGRDPEHRSYRSFASFHDPDGNGWLFQEITTRLPGRIDPATTTFASASDLASALRRAAAAHGEHEKRIGRGRCELARLVCRVYGGGAERREASDVIESDLIIGGSPGAYALGPEAGRLLLAKSIERHAERLSGKFYLSLKSVAV